jgi:hypothetical protein
MSLKHMGLTIGGRKLMAHDQLQKTQGLKLLVGLLCAVDGTYYISLDSSAIIDGLPRLGSDLDL